ncbi:MAG: DNA-3-methyladenine glycosylase I [Chloroflexi bacterium]|nr:DNA-3-methyladenine glycosylase I [Chloroflexota bacterium]
MTDDKIRCPWCVGDPLYEKYHDEEWGTECHDDRRWFEKIVLEGAQAGLSWITVLRKREAYRAAFDKFDVHKVARYDDAKIEALLLNAGLIRNRLKMRAAVKNANAFIRIQEEFGSFDAYIWRFTGEKPIVNAFTEMREIPAVTPEAEAMSKDLKKRGFTFVGPTICYAMMQSCGMVDDHLESCWRRAGIEA